MPAEAVAGLVDAGLADVGLEEVGFAVVGFALLAAGVLLFSAFSEDTFAESDLACPAGLAGAFRENSAEQLPHFTRLSAGIDLISMGCLHFGHCSVGIKTISPTAALTSPTAIVPNEIQIDVSNRNSTC